MAKFNFRLATLLRLREAARDRRRIELAEAYRVDDLLRGQLDQVAEELDRLKQHCRQIAAPGQVDVDWLIEAQRYELTLQARRRQIEQQQQAVAGEINRRRQALVEANREVRVLQKLREKQARRHRGEQVRQENKLLDEVAVQRAAREEIA